MLTFDFDYPRLRQSLGVAALREAQPTLLLNLRGDITGVNALALWLFGGLQLGEPFHPETLLGMNTFTLSARLVQRIPVEQNEDMYTKLSAIVKRNEEQRGKATDPSFIAAMYTDARRAAIYDTAPLHPDRAWEYTLRIAHPQDAGIMLEYQAQAFRLEGSAGFLLIYYPRSATFPTNEVMQNRFAAQYGEDGGAIAVQLDGAGNQYIPPRPAAAYRSYYPYILQDPLWYIYGENEAHRLLMGITLQDLHFFDIFLSPALKQMMGPIQESTAPRAMKYFDVFTAPYLRDEHELHQQYAQTIRRLEATEGFDNLLALSRRIPTQASISAMLHQHVTPEKPFYTCRVILPWRYNSDIRLEFKSMVSFIYPDALVLQPDIRSYQVSLVPANNETDVALILLPMLAALSSPSSPSFVNDESDSLLSTPFAQFAWLLALLRVIEEGLSTSEEDTRWHPREAFERVRHTLALHYGDDPAGETKDIITEIRVTLELLERGGKIERAKLLPLLRTYTLQQPNLQQLSDFLAKEA